MKTVKRIPLGIINIAATPHSKGGSTYVDLLKEAFQLNLPVKIRGDEYAMLASCVALDESGLRDIMTGEIHKFTDIKGDWENLQLRKAATETDLAKVQIPEHLKPNREVFRYFLFPREHRFVFQLHGAKRSISHVGVSRLLETLFSHSEIKKKFPLVTVVVEQEPETLSRILALPRLDLFSICLKRPNPDEADPEEIRFVDNLLSEQEAASMQLTLNHAPGVSLKPDENNQRLARVAATSYGSVIGKGRDEHDRPIEINTSEHPIKEPFDYNNKTRQGFVDQMFSAARRLVEKVTRRREHRQ